jgi:antitoxin CptB
MEERRKRARMRAWRRGTREMDLILGPYADAHLAAMDAAALADFEAVLAEADGDLAGWLLGGRPGPAALAPALARIAAFAAARTGGRTGPRG